MKVILCQSGDFKPQLRLMPIVEEKFPNVQFIVLRHDTAEQLENHLFYGRKRGDDPAE